MSDNGFIEMTKTATLHEIEKSIILARVAAMPESNLSAVAETLGIGKTTLYRKLKEYAKHTL